MMDPELQSSLRSLADRVAVVRPPENLEPAVMAEFDRLYGLHRSRNRKLKHAPLAGALAASLLAGALLMRPQPKAAVPVESQAFVPIPYTSPLQPYERVTVVQTEVPVRALIAAGFHVQTSDPGGSVPAEVMVSQDGRPRAYRPVAFVLSPGRNNR